MFLLATVEFSGRNIVTMLISAYLSPCRFSYHPIFGLLE